MAEKGFKSGNKLSGQVGLSATYPLSPPALTVALHIFRAIAGT